MRGLADSSRPHHSSERWLFGRYRGGLEAYLIEPLTQQRDRAAIAVACGNRLPFMPKQFFPDIARASRRAQPILRAMTERMHRGFLRITDADIAQPCAEPLGSRVQPTR